MADMQINLFDAYHYAAQNKTLELYRDQYRQSNHLGGNGLK